jgi:hypothetical protein
MNGSATTTQAPAKPRPAARRRRVIGSFGSYADAERILEHLPDGRFGGERSTIIARDLSFVERGGRVRAAFDSAARGAAGGALIGLLIGAFVYGAIAGAIAGALAGLAVRALRRGSATQMEARAYDVLVDEHLADDAMRVLVDAGSTDHATASRRPVKP